MDSSQFNFSQAQKMLGLGMPPTAYGTDGALEVIGDACDPRGKMVICEVARWRIDLPVADAATASTFGPTIDVFGTANGKPPPGVSVATNTLAVPGQIPGDMLITGISQRILVEPEARTILGNFFPPGAVASMPGSPDVWTLADQVNGALGIAGGQGNLLPAEFAWGLATWRVAYALVNAYESVWSKNHETRLFQQPLTQTSHIEPFAEAEAAGLAFASNQDRVLILNQRLQALGITSQFLLETHRRTGSQTVAGNNVGNFTPSRAGDASSSMFGGIGVPLSSRRDPMRFAQPIFWPAGHSMAIQWQVNDPAYQAEMQRWLSVTGAIGGVPGSDLNLPQSNVAGLSGFAPTTPGAAVMLEQTIDIPTPTAVTEQVQTNRAILKGGALVFEVALVGQRIGESWKQYIAKAIKQGAIQCPDGYGSLSSMVAAA